MSREVYRLTEPAAGFSAGAILDVTARFGDWHVHDIELEPRRSSPTTPSKVAVTEADAGFSEAEILDETARLGDWHDRDLAFDPAADTSTTITMETLEAVAERVDPVEVSAVEG